MKMKMNDKGITKKKVIIGTNLVPEKNEIADGNWVLWNLL
jgi:hypothetical protein